MRPAHRDLQNMVQLMQRQLPRYDNPPPDGWLNFYQANKQFVFVVRANRWHHLLLSYHTLPLQGVFTGGHLQQHFQPEFEVRFGKLLLNRTLAQLLGQGEYVAVNLAKASHLVLEARKLGALVGRELECLEASQLFLEDPEILALSGKCALDTVDRVVIKHAGFGFGPLQGRQLLLVRLDHAINMPSDRREHGNWVPMGLLCLRSAPLLFF